MVTVSFCCCYSGGGWNGGGWNRWNGGGFGGRRWGGGWGQLRPLKLLHNINFFFFFTMISRRGLGTRRLLGLETEASKPESAVLLIPPLKTATTTTTTTTTHYVLSALETVRAPSYFFTSPLFSHFVTVISSSLLLMTQNK